MLSSNVASTLHALRIAFHMFADQHDRRTEIRYYIGGAGKHLVYSSQDGCINVSYVISIVEHPRSEVSQRNWAGQLGVG